MADDNAAPLPARGADLPTRLVSAFVMLALAGAALAIGGVVLDAFIFLVALIAFVEFVRLVFAATASWPLRIGATALGAAYFGVAAAMLAGAGTFLLILVIGIAVFTDTGAFIAGRTIGGPKIAPAISPSKTWAGLAGGMIAAAAWVFLWIMAIDSAVSDWLGPRFEIGLNLSFENMFGAISLGATLAVVAQAGDFLESWLKRRAGVKDSSRLIPGHGGVLDRIDGLVPVALVAGWLAAQMAA
jgi:phosphatidate cytidylyltransferase